MNARHQNHHKEEEKEKEEEEKKKQIAADECIRFLSMQVCDSGLWPYYAQTTDVNQVFSLNIDFK